ncbi:MAG: transporter, partial [Paracoccaceae bacterium]
MNRIFTVGAALMLTTTAATAGGLDRTGGPINIIFEDGNYAELTYSNVSPDISGVFPVPVPVGSGNIAENYGQVGFGFKYQIDARASIAFIY